MTIGKKLYLIFSVILIAIIIIATLNFIQMGRIEKEYKFILNDRVEKVNLLQQIDNAVSLQGLNTRAYYINKQPIQLDNLKTQDDLIQKNLKQLDETITEPKAIEYVATIRDNQNQFLSLFETTKVYIDSNNQTDALQIMNNDIRTVNEGINGAIANLIELQNNLKDQSIKETNKTLDAAQKIVIGSVILLVIVILIFSITTTRKMTQSIKKINDVSNEIANGNLLVDDVVVNTKDELNELATSFNIMKENLRNLVTNVSMNIQQTTAISEELVASTDQLTISSQGVAANAAQLAAGGKQSSVLGKQTSYAMDEMANSIAVIADTASQLNDNATNTQHLANKGENILLTAENQMEVIQKSSKQTNTQMKQLAIQSNEIATISDSITAIADQTNLLALNAAIEAARAGEHGKGFAVVADEVRKLAEQSKASANEINELTQSILLEMKNVEVAVEDTSKNVDQGVEYITSAQKMFDEIVKDVTRMVENIVEVSASTEEVSASTQEVTASVNEMSGAAEQVSVAATDISSTTNNQFASVEEVNNIAKTLNADAMKLQNEINQFKY